MPTHDVVRATFERSTTLYDDLVAEIPEAALASRLPALRSNTIGGQLWCVVGARESYARAIAAGEWVGFSCSLPGERCHERAAVAGALRSSASPLLDAMAAAGPLTDPQHRLVLDAIEPEAAHHGQLIRYLYGLDLPIPESWKKRYALA